MKEGEQLVHETTYEEEKNLHIPTTKESGIVMPNPSIWPLITAAGIVAMFCGMPFMDKKPAVAVAMMILGTLWWVGSLYKWLLTPLEDHH